MIADLIARLEAATGPDRELDALILAAMVGGAVDQSPINGNWCVFVGTERNGRPRLWEPRTANERMWWTKKDFTASLDAAMSLVPEGCLFYARTLWDEDKTAGLASVSRYTPWPNRMFVDDTTGVAATPALALCIAALKAREAAQ